MNIGENIPHIHQGEPISLGVLAAGWLAIHDPQLSTSPVNTTLLAEVVARHQVEDLIESWQRLEALPTVRAFVRQRRALTRQTCVGPPAFIINNEGTIWWNDIRMGTQEVLFQHVLPQERQARLAYETFRYRFLRWLERNYHVLLVGITDAVVTISVPDGRPSPNITEACQP